MATSSQPASPAQLGRWAPWVTVAIAAVILTREALRIGQMPTRAEPRRVIVRVGNAPPLDSEEISAQPGINADRSLPTASPGSDRSPPSVVAVDEARTVGSLGTEADLPSPPSRKLSPEETRSWVPTNPRLGPHSCKDNRTVARTGAWSRAGQRLGNTLCMLGRALIEASDAGGGVLELLSPGSRYYNTTAFAFSKDLAAKFIEPWSSDGSPWPQYFVLIPARRVLLVHDLPRFHRFRDALQHYVLPNFLAKPLRLSDDTLVIHVRSGDVMRTTRGVKYWQPPLKYYKYIIETFHPESKITLATEVHGDADGIVGGNPVVAELLKWRPEIQFPPPDFHNDVATLLGARYLVQAVSSFSATLAIMSPRLRRTYIPRPVKLRATDSECCNCSRTNPDGGGLSKEWNCGAQSAWQQNDGKHADIVQILLAGYDPGNQHDFLAKSRTMLEWNGPVCHTTFPEPPG